MSSRTQDSDREDVRRVLEGDAEAFEGIVRRWQSPLVNLAYRYCRNPGEAEEMAQEAFLRAFRFLDRWRDDAPFSTWLFAVASNVYRSHVRRVRLPEVPLESDRHARTDAGPHERLESIDTAETVRRMVSALPTKYRDAVILFYFLDRDLAGTARSLDLPEGTVKARLHRARGLLQSRLTNVVGTPQSAEAT